MKTLYLCNKKKACYLSPMCGRSCKHTFDERYRMKGDFFDYTLIRIPSTGEIIMREDEVLEKGE